MKVLHLLLIASNTILLCNEAKPLTPEKNSTHQPNSIYLEPGLRNITTPAEFESRWKSVAHSRINNLDGINSLDRPINGQPAEQSRDCDGNCWDLVHVGDDTQWYLSSGAAQDTFAIAFWAGVPCMVEEVYIKWFNEGTVTAFAALLSDSAAAAVGTGGSSIDLANNVIWPRGSMPFSPIGELLTEPTVNIIPDYTPDWTHQLDVGGSFEVSNEEDLNNPPVFLIVFVKQDDFPQPLASDVFEGRSFNFFGGPWTDPDGDITTPDGTYGDGYAWGNYQSDASIENGLIDVACMVRIQNGYGPHGHYYPHQTNDTYNTDGQKNIIVDVFSGWDSPFGCEPQVSFFWTLNGILQEEISITNAVPLEVDEYGNGEYEFTINYQAEPGDVIGYWCEGVDVWCFDVISWPMDFEVLEPGEPCADLLFIQDNLHHQYAGQFETLAASSNISFEIWNTEQHHGIDESVINYGWSSIFVYGWGNEYLPVTATENDPGFGTFLANGGNLILVDQDWFFGHDLPQWPPNLEFQPGDPAYEWFGLSGAVNDPDEDDMVMDFDDGMLSLIPELPYNPELLVMNHSAYGTLNWFDYLYPGTADAIFMGNNSEEITGVRNQYGDSQTIFLAFMADAAIDTTDSGDIILDQMVPLMDFLLADVSSPPAIEILPTLPEVVFNDQGQVIDAVVVDHDIDELMVECHYRVDDGLIEILPMELQTAHQYSATIPAQAGGASVSFWVTAYEVLNQDCNYSESDVFSYSVFHPTSDILLVLNNEMGSDAYPGLYYFYDNTEGDLWIYPDFWQDAVTSELLAYYDTVFEITTTGTWGNFYDHYDIIQDWLQEGDKNYFLAGDDFFGMLLGWEDTTFNPGDFWYELGVNQVYHDIDVSGPVEISPESEGNPVSGELWNMIAETGTQLYYDPQYELGYNCYLDGLVPVEGESESFLNQSNTDHVIGVFKEWDNGNRTVVLAADPLAINSQDPYIWWGARPEGIMIQTLEWFTAENFVPDCDSGDLNADGSTNILDIVLAVGCVLGTTFGDHCECDLNLDGSWDVLDIVILVDWVLNQG